MFVPGEMKLLGTDVASIPTNEVAPHQFGLAVVVTGRGVQRSLANLMRKHENVCSPLMEDIRVGLMLEFDKLTEGSSFFLYDIIDIHQVHQGQFQLQLQERQENRK